MEKKQTVFISPTSRPPIVAVLGHVDHGKTTLLDFIRKTSVTAKEHGGITQHIGAYQVKVKTSSFDKATAEVQTVKSKGEGEKLITFIDTPGHEAFAKMRSRGATVADIAVLVVAADDSVKPQTKESIDQIKAANIPLIVALNKMDLPGTNPEKVKQDLARSGVQVEGFGGDVPIIPISAKTGVGVPDLLEMILLVSEMKEIKTEQEDYASVVVVETKVDKGKGIVATVIVKKGLLGRGDALHDGQKQVAKVRAMFDENGQAVSVAPPSMPVEVIGFTEQPAIGATLTTKPEGEKHPAESAAVPKPALAGVLPDFLKAIDPEKEKKLTIVLKADAAGSLEAIGESLDQRVQIVATGIGDITEADILLAKSSGAVILGFNVRYSTSVVKLAETEKVVFRTYTIIYQLLDELKEVLAGLKEVTASDRELGSGQIIAEFPYEDSRIAGTKVLSGRLIRGDLVKLLRGDTEIGRAKIKTIRMGKEDAGKVAAGNECGVLIDRKLDFKLGDSIIAYTTG